jgi:hypothetical protein
MDETDGTCDHAMRGWCFFVCCVLLCCGVVSVLYLLKVAVGILLNLP